MPKVNKNTENKDEKESAQKSTAGARKIAKVEKRNKVKKPSKEEEVENLWPLGKNRYAKVHEFMGSVFVDIRCYYFKNGDIRPGKAGISLAMEQWQKLMKCIEEIDEIAKAMNEA